MDKYCLIVDPYISGALLSFELRKNNIIPIAILTPRIKLSQEEFNRRFNSTDYLAVFHYQEEKIQELLQQLSKFPIARVIAGNESSVDIADQLAMHFTPQFANPPSSANSRKNKYEMQEVARAAGLNAVKQMKVFSASLTSEQKQNLASWKFPVIVKPDSSAASLGVSLCENLTQIESALVEIIGQPCGFTGILLDSAVIQNCLRGKEYFVDTVSLNGQTCVASVQHYFKTVFNNKNIYRYIEISNPHSHTAKSCIDYIKPLLNAVELHNGFAHTEIFLTPEPYLVEVNPRISGTSGMVNKLCWYTTGENQATLMALSINDPNKFLTLCQQPPLPLKQHGRILFLQNWNPKTIGELRIDQLKNFSSYYEHLQLKPAGSQLGFPESLPDTVAFVLLVHPSHEQIVSDTEAIFELEKKGLLF